MSEPRGTVKDMQPEPWMRGPIGNLHPVAAHLFYTFQQAREEVPRDLTPQQVWQTVAGTKHSIGFHLRHIAGSIDRLATYLDGRALTDAQLATLRAEHDPDATLESLLQTMEDTMSRVEQQVSAIDPAQYLEPRGIGRKQLPTTVAGLIIHISEHTQRHLAQIALLARML